MMDWKSVGIMTFPIYGKINHVPNHQAVLKFIKGKSSIEKDDKGTFQQAMFDYLRVDLNVLKQPSTKIGGLAYKSHPSRGGWR